MIAQEKYVRHEPQLDRSKIHCSPESLYNFHISLIARTGYHFMPVINQFILKSTQSGILRRWKTLQIYENGWINQNASQFTLLKIGEDRSFEGDLEHNNNKIISLDLQHIVGALFVLSIGYSIALTVFVMEITIKYLSKKMNGKLLSIFNSILDPSTK